ncbi:flagellar hook-basal body complex protein FliE [Virgibacillus sp. Bac332]|uniref:flagellar hook-basal body complex protein FliE n=1 Tax=Virgibacillus sp. Bac332 TaxID=2419842 RepID=UPI000EF5174C|nr:flagellar hook-basal body complex protein FliE [Virgibacillus sp. Bac332]
MIQSIGNQIPQAPVSSQLDSKPAISAGEAQGKFAAALKNAINDVNQAQIASDQKTEALANRKIDDLHDVMITAQKASITLETTVQVQKKVVDAYKEVMSMQV